jgi:hypothetical protein
VEQVPQDLSVIRSDPDNELFGPVVEDELVGELAGLSSLLGAPVGVDVGDLPNLDGLLGLLLLAMLLIRHESPPRTR